MATGAQEKSIAGFLSDLGVVGFAGIAATIGSPNTKLVITVTQPAWAILADGTLLAAELATTSITGLSTNGTYALYLDYTTTGAYGTDFAPVWTVAASAPSATALKVADVIVGSSHLTSVANVAVGLQGLPISGVTSSELTAMLAAIPTTAVADVSAANAANAAGANPDAAEFAVVVTLVNSLKVQLNLALARLRTAGIVTP